MTTKKSPRLNKQDLELIAKGLNHLKNFHREDKDRDLKTYNDIEADNIIDLAMRLDLDGDHFNYEGRNEE